jgi:small subunit ribosomal protein S3|tara:strand:- start:1008 stop:1667 length:660 start_codon:yes stop_codon:yes gene_type:complete
MGQKVNPNGFRLGVSKKQNANWYAKGKDFSTNLIQDLKVRAYLNSRLKNSSISKIELERTADTFVVNIHTARPGIIIGKRGEEIENLKKAVEKIVKGSSQINIKEVKKPDLDAQILAEGVAQQLEKRVMFRRAMKRTVQSALRQSAKGVRIEVSGRLNGAEIARTEWYREGRVPLHTLRADIDYGTAEALTTYGIIGVKVWVYRGEITEDPYKLNEGAR